MRRAAVLGKARKQVHGGGDVWHEEEQDDTDSEVDYRRGVGPVIDHAYRPSDINTVGQPARHTRLLIGRIACRLFVTEERAGRVPTLTARMRKILTGRAIGTREEYEDMSEVIYARAAIMRGIRERLER